jgi:hypothetical protein
VAPDLRWFQQRRALYFCRWALWDLARSKGFTWRSYGEYVVRASDGTTTEAAPGADTYRYIRAMPRR